MIRRFIPVFLLEFGLYIFIVIKSDRICDYARKTLLFKLYYRGSWNDIRKFFNNFLEHVRLPPNICLESVLESLFRRKIHLTVNILHNVFQKTILRNRSYMEEISCLETSAHPRHLSKACLSLSQYKDKSSLIKYLLHVEKRQKSCQNWCFIWTISYVCYI